jgi:serine/threonine protein kinase
MSQDPRASSEQHNPPETVSTQLPVTPEETLEHTGESRQQAGRATQATTTEVPSRLGRYDVERLLGRGGFGCVYLARDEKLQRHVTIKVPHRRHIKTSGDVDKLLAEARTLAKLDHPNVVPVHDADHTDDGLCYVVSRFIDGSDLNTRMKQSPLSVGEAVEMIATVAEALHYVHTCGIVHRDIKPGNILLDKRARPYVADFGLALQDDQFMESKRTAGTPSYMSPEQSRGENHLIDGRSDVFSLGVVLYELLVGTRPFLGDSTVEILRQVQTHEPQPLREVHRNIQAELDRICMKALAKRAADRYKTALDFSEDLKQFLNDDTGLSVVGAEAPSSAEISGLHSSQQFLGVMPKGLRSFEREDAHFFQRLLPGARGRDGMPDSIRFWKRRITSVDPENSFRVGLIYGPSGCGKSSFVKAGLLPTLPDSVIPVFVEAAPQATESRLLNRLRRQCPYLPTDLGLRKSITRLRHGQVMGAEKKVLVVVDQFEQWLYSTDQQADSELALALRQCDGENVQCMLLVRDDFWLAVSRFMSALEIELLQNKNMALVDLFDELHARKVLAEFGQAFGQFPDHFSALTSDQIHFLDQAIDGLAEDAKVIPVRLALFAEMVKGKPWTPETLKRIGGITGVGLMFLDECFTSANAPAEHRVHEQAVHATLKELLPRPGANIKGSMRSREELLAVSGYDERPAEFKTLLRVLDAELRLITPTDTEDNDHGEESGSAASSQHQYYQLTHDYLVPAIREWLARAQRESRRGRAEIRLAERAEIWTARPDARHLPSYLEWLNILAFAKTRQAWTGAQRRMMKAATRRYAIWTIVAAAACLFAAVGLREFNSFNKARSLTEQLATANVSEVPDLLEQLQDCRRWATPKLEAAWESAEEGTRGHLFLSLAMLRRDPSLAEDLGRRALTADPETLELLCDELTPHRSKLVPGLWECLADESADDARRFNAALVLARYDPPQTDGGDDHWKEQADFVADLLIDKANVDRQYYPATLRLIRPARGALLERLSHVFIDDHATEVRRSSATGLLVDFLRDDPQQLADTFLDADVDQLKVVLSVLDEHQSAVREVLSDNVANAIDASVPKEERIRLSHRRGIAAALMLRHGAVGDEVWDVFNNCGFADARSLVIHRVRPLGARPQLIAERLQAETDDSIRQGLLQALGEYEPNQLPSDLNARTIQLAKGWFQTGRDAGVRGSSMWLLQRWGQQDWLVNARSQLQELAEDPRRNWHVDRHGHNMVRLRNDSGDEAYSFDFAAAEVTMEQLKQFDPGHKLVASTAPTLDCPAVTADWHSAVAYCNWLSREAGLGEEELCYPDWKEGEPVVELYPDYRTRKGYRLPTREEWFIACRGGTQTPFFFGEDRRRIEGYALLFPESNDRTWPTGNSKPNDYGIFDMITNVIEWISDGRSGGKRGVCGKHYGSRFDEFFDSRDQPRIAWDSPTLRWSYIGFRVARSRPDVTQ